MIFKFRRAVAVVVLCVVLFTLSTFVPSTRDTPMGGFMHGFSMGMGAIAILAAVYFYVKAKEERKRLESEN